VAIPKSGPRSISSVHNCTVNDSTVGLLVTRMNVRLPADSSSLTIVVLKRTVTTEQKDVALYKLIKQFLIYLSLHNNTIYGIF